MRDRIELSVVIPVFDEEKNLPLLYSRLSPVLKRLKKNYEIIFVDDGSRDSSFEILKQLGRCDKKIRIVKFRKNFGQTAALAAGFEQARGELVATLDADLQNDSRDLPMLLKKIEEGYDLVSGWRRRRHDPTSRKIPSIFANELISCLTGVRLHDYGCTLKVYRKEGIKNINLYGEMHRFIQIGRAHV